MDTKECRKCKENKPLSEYYVQKDKKTGYERLKSICKKCDNKASKLYKEKNKEKVRKKEIEWKERNADRLREKRKKEWAENKNNPEYLKYKALKQKRYYNKNREKIREKQKWENLTEEQLRKRKERSKKYREENKKELKKRKRRYYEETYERRKHIYRENWARYNARKLKAIPVFLRDCEIEKKRLKDIYLLSRLLSKATGIIHHVDHMWPIGRGGPHWSGNLQIIKAEENYKKNASVDKNIKHTIKQMLMELEKANAKGE